MNLTLNQSVLEGYRSKTQMARVLTEAWVAENMFCPRCGNVRIHHFSNNRPVADFYCPKCQHEYELKSSQKVISNKVADGAYETMIHRITSSQNPDFFFMRYDLQSLMVKDLLLIPKHFFVPEIIEKRKPLKSTARRAGWVGCNIKIAGIPKQGRIHIIRDGMEIDASTVVEEVHRGQSLEVKNINARGWLLDVLNCVNQLPKNAFSLDEMYAFEDVLKQRHPLNNNIRPKIRQQLQVLRDKGFVDFIGNGKYYKL